MTARKMHLVLPGDLEAEVASAVATGEYASEEDVLRDAVAEWRAQRLAEAMGLEELRRLWQEGVESGAGRSWSIDEIKAEARRRTSLTRS